MRLAFCCFVFKFIENIMMDTRHKIIVVGGYGAVGQYICEMLHRHPHVEIVVAGRDLAKATSCANRLSGARARLFDIHTADYSAIQDAALLILCVESKNNKLAAYCLSAGIHYLDITASSALIDAIERLNKPDFLAKSLALVSVGLAPGLSNLLAKHSVNRHLQSDWVAIDIMLGLGEKHGRAAFNWTFDHMHSRYIIQQDQQAVQVRSFTAPRAVILDQKRRFFLFNFSDQHMLAKLWPAKNIKTRLAFDAVLVTELLYLARQVGLTRILRIKRVQAFLYFLFHRFTIGSDRFIVRASCGIDKRELYRATFAGNSEGKATAAVAAELALQMLHSKQTGVLHINEFISDVPGFIQNVADYDPSFSCTL